MTTIYWAGDSTVQFNNIFSYPQTGIGQVMPMFLKRDVRVDNRAVNGRSTKSFIDEFRMAYIYDNITEGDFLFIQFGHNDEKEADPARFTRPEAEFTENLRKFVSVARNKKAHPVFITPLERRCFDENGVLGPCTHEAYTAAMIKAGEMFDVPVIDLTKMSREKLMEALWETDCYVDDNTLTVNIGRLRKRLEGLGLKAFITTKFGVGYIVGE